MKRIYLIVLLIILYFSENIYAELIDGPANIRNQPKGTVIMSLNDYADVKVLFKSIDKWQAIQIRAVFNANDIQDNIISKGTKFFDLDGKEKGITMIPIDIIKWARKYHAHWNSKYISNIFKENNRYVIEFNARTHATNLRTEKKPKKITAFNIIPTTISGSNNLIFEEYRTPRTCGGGMVEGLEDCIPREVWDKRSKWKYDLKQEDFEWDVLESGENVYDAPNKEIRAKLEKKHGYKSVFNYSLIKEIPFFFFIDSDGFTRVSFAGKVMPVKYSKVYHYGCCSDSILNPWSNDLFVAFYAEKFDEIYYVEAGVYE